MLVRLGIAAARLGRMPGQCGETADVYRCLAIALQQFEKHEEVKARAQEHFEQSAEISADEPMPIVESPARSDAG